MASDQDSILQPSPPCEPSDDALTTAILAELPRLRRHALYRLFSHADADDLVQDCLEAALRKRASLQEPAKLRGWLFAILNNLFLMHRRASGSRGRALQIEDFAESLAASA